MLPGPVSRLPGQHHGQVTALACAYLDGRPVAYSGGQDGMVRVWDLLDRHLVEIIDVPGPIFAIHATAEGDLQALAVMADFAWWLALGLANLANIFDPECIVLGGGLILVGNLIVEAPGWARTQAEPEG